MLLLRTNKISVKSHLQTAAIFKCAIKVLTSWNITESVWKKGLYSGLCWCILGGGGRPNANTPTCEKDKLDTEA